MAKSKLTLDIERALYNSLNGRQHIGCHEVTIGMYGNQIVDFITVKLDKTREVRCFEIKVSKADFNSKAKLTFVGDKNYFVMPVELYREVEKDIPKGIGCYIYQNGHLHIVKNSRKKEVKDREGIFLNILRSFNREFYKAYGITPYQDNTTYRAKKEDKRLGDKIYGKD